MKPSKLSLVAILACLTFASPAVASAGVPEVVRSWPQPNSSGSIPYATYHCPNYQHQNARNTISEELENLVITIPHNSLWRSFQSWGEKDRPKRSRSAVACTFAVEIAIQAASLPERVGSAYPSY